VQPRSSQNRIAGLHGDAIKVQIAAAPERGAANEAVEKLVAGWLGLPRYRVKIAHGRTGRDKILMIATEEPGALGERIEALLKATVDNEKARG
jgi:hypothetical protein